MNLQIADRLTAVNIVWLGFVFLNAIRADPVRFDDQQRPDKSK